MKYASLNEVPFQPVSHDPRLNKKVLLGPGVLPHVAALSHIELGPGDSVESHRHGDAHEVFYGLKGRVEFVVGGRAVSLSEGSSLVVEPGEAHAIEGAEEGSRMLYFLLVKDG
jgi:quercetin dioxygenase-like cupin family protein